eukprot:5221143-Amphidinium_carterae.2
MRRLLVENLKEESCEAAVQRAQKRSDPTDLVWSHALTNKHTFRAIPSANEARAKGFGFIATTRDLLQSMHGGQPCLILDLWFTVMSTRDHL